MGMLITDHVFSCILVATTTCQTFEPLRVPFLGVRVIFASPFDDPNVCARLDMRWGCRHDARTDIFSVLCPNEVRWYSGRG